MKKYFALILSFTLIFLCTAPAHASSTFANPKSLLNDAVSLDISNGSYVRTISSENIQLIRDSFSSAYHIQSADYSALGKQLLSAVGYDDLELRSFTHDELSEIALQAGSIVSTSTYYKQDKTTYETSIITEEEFIESLSTQVQNTCSPASARSGGSHTMETGDLCFQITSTAIYYPNFVYDPIEDIEQDGWFSFSGIVTYYEAVPLGYDCAISLAIEPTIVAWDDTDSAFSSTMTRVRTNGQTDQTYKVTTDRYIQPGGVYYIWNPGLSYGTETLSISIRGLGRVRDYREDTFFNSYVGYVHNQTIAEPQFSWSIPPGVSVTLNISNQATSYYGYCYVTYSP